MKKKIKVVDVAVGGRHCFALADTGQVYSWGFGFYYQLGTGSTEDKMEPSEVSTFRKVEKISCGYFHTAMIYS
jgi:alpha-tubulin suppressor-like RCC1 family protein